MSHFVTELQEALVAELSTLQDGDGIAFDVARGYEESVDLPQRAEASIYVGADACRTQAHSPRFSLEQCIIPLTLQQRANYKDLQAVDDVMQLSQRVFDLLRNWSYETFRIESMTAPVAFDRAKLSSPGLFVQKILLDCDVLRTVGEDPEAAPESAELTIARKAVWAAINASDFSTTWARKYQTDADLEELTLRDPGPAELPALALYWGETRPEWFVNVMQEWPSLMTATAWLPASMPTLGETIVQELVQAVFRATVGSSSVPEVKKQIGHYPTLRNLKTSLVPIGRSGLRRAVRCDVQFDLTSFFDPLHPGSP